MYRILLEDCTTVLHIHIIIPDSCVHDDIVGSGVISDGSGKEITVLVQQISDVAIIFKRTIRESHTHSCADAHVNVHKYVK